MRRLAYVFSRAARESAPPTTISATDATDATDATGRFPSGSQLTLDGTTGDVHEADPSDRDGRPRLPEVPR
ncbi:hypothetical protein ACIBKX_01075 [Streptomyces sp. NPDC050658]|uniref:hypothetical protein n=1 Tax=unclassified Streptomyces TaxID=2593676 RepID=UPI003420350A